MLNEFNEIQASFSYDCKIYREIYAENLGQHLLRGINNIGNYDKFIYVPRIQI